MNLGDTFYRIAFGPVEQGFQLSRGTTADHIGQALAAWSFDSLQGALAQAASAVAEIAGLQNEAPNYATIVPSWDTPMMRLQEVQVLHAAAMTAYEEARPAWAQGVFELGRAFVQAGALVANIKTLGVGRKHVARARELVHGEVNDAEHAGVRAAVQDSLAALEQGVALYHSQLELMQAEINQNQTLATLVRRREGEASLGKSAGSFAIVAVALGLGFSAFWADQREAAAKSAPPAPSYVAVEPPREPAPEVAPPALSAPVTRPASGARSPKKNNSAPTASAAAVQPSSRVSRDACLKTCIGKCQDDSSCERACLGGCP